jgi:hypothetical protein
MLVLNEETGEWYENDTYIPNPDDDTKPLNSDDTTGDDDTTGGDDYVSPYYTSNFTWGDAPDEEGSNTVVDPKTGNITYTYREPDGSTSTMTVGPNGVPIGSTESPTISGNSTAYNRSLLWATKTFGPTAGKVFSNIMANPGASIMTAIAAAKAFAGSDKTGGYNVPVPKMNTVSEQIQYNDPNRRAGSSGRQYMTDTRYVKEGDTAGLAAAQAAVDAQKAGILAAYQPAVAEVNPYAGKMKTKWNAPTTSNSQPVNNGIATTYPNSNKRIDDFVNVVTDANKVVGIPAIPISPPNSNPETPRVLEPSQPNMGDIVRPNFDKETIEMAAGGIAALAQGGNPRYLQGKTDGMADEIASRIDGGQEAALSHGEFVIPADVVSHLGNGNSDAGAKKLYQMMDRIRQARTGTKEQGKKINPDKFMPGGLAAAYAAGGGVMGFAGPDGSAVTNTATTAGGVPLDTSKTSGLSPWAGEYVTNMLGKTEALANTPTAVYGGPLTAGASDLQKQGFAGVSDIASAGFDPTKFTSGTFNANAANQYMNPYLQSVLDPQMAELRRQNDITNMGANAKLTQAGAYGGGRQAIMNAENNRNLMQEMNKTVGSGYASAFDKAMAQFNTEQGRQFDVDKASEASRQYSADYGLKTANDLLRAGETQRGIESEGIAADKKQFEQQQADPYNRLEFQRKMVEGLPIGMTTSETNQDAVSKMQSDISGLLSLYKTLNKLIPT